MELRCRDHVLSLERVAVMGVLNVTPDSFSDGGLWFDQDRAVEHGVEMVAQGAAIVDVGGESTRPGAEPVPESEELRRVIPVVEQLASELDVPISIDTRKSSVAKLAVDAGASIINDTLGEEPANGIEDIAASTNAAVVTMHSRGTPATMRSLTQYDDVVRDVSTWLAARAEALLTAGVPRNSIAIDPGIGFAKTPEQNLLLLNRLEDVVALGFPVLVGTSRKSFIGAVLDVSEQERLEGTAVTIAWAVQKGARIVRVHDVQEMSRVVRMTEALLDPEELSN